MASPVVRKPPCGLRGRKERIYMEDNDGIVLLMSAASPVDAELMCGLLEQEEIPFMTKVRGAGAMYGGGFYGMDVFVSASDFPAASAVLADWVASPLGCAELPGLDED